MDPFINTGKSERLASDMFGLVEQLICVNAVLWLGTAPFSTFTANIFKMRHNEALDFVFPEAPLRLPAVPGRGTNGTGSGGGGPGDGGSDAGGE